jgi:hypothetical protein
MSSAGRDRDDRLSALGAELPALVAAQAIRDGYVSLEGKSDAEVLSAIGDIIREIAEGQDPIFVGIDHQATLAAEAARYHEAGKHELAVMLYATLIEHRLNGLILLGARRQGLEDEDGKRIIREANLRAKMTWVWQLLFGETIPDVLVGRINRLAEKRNSFVHYKWQVSDADSYAKDEEFEQISREAPQLIHQLEELEDRLIFSGRQDAIMRLFAQGPDTAGEAPC